MKNVEATSIGAARGHKPSFRWPLIVVGLLSGHVLLMIVACTIAIRDKTFAVVPDYYGKAIEWDQQKAARLASAKLGWHVEVQAGRHIDPQGRRNLSFVLTDAQGKPIEGAQLEAAIFHHAHAEQVQRVMLTEDPTDLRRFTVRPPMTYPGNWEFHFTVTARGQTFVSSAVEYLEND